VHGDKQCELLKDPCVKSYKMSISKYQVLKFALHFSWWTSQPIFANLHMNASPLADIRTSQPRAFFFLFPLQSVLQHGGRLNFRDRSDAAATRFVACRDDGSVKIGHLFYIIFLQYVNHAAPVRTFFKLLLFWWREAMKDWCCKIDTQSVSTVDPRVTTGLTYRQLGLRPTF
jgi:hypothetical protein